jgi:hypothetical protein
MRELHGLWNDGEAAALSFLIINPTRGNRCLSNTEMPSLSGLRTTRRRPYHQNMVGLLSEGQEFLRGEL